MAFMLAMMIRNVTLSIFYLKWRRDKNYIKLSFNKCLSNVNKLIDIIIQGVFFKKNDIGSSLSNFKNTGLISFIFLGNMAEIR